METSLDLFAFDFSQDQEELFSEGNVLKEFKKLQQISKEQMNSYLIRLEKLPSGMFMLIDKFVENGWVERRDNYGIYLLDEHLSHYTVEEVITTFKNNMKRMANKENVCWYGDMIEVINHSPAPIRWLDDLNEKFRKLKNEVVTDYAFKFGLDHFKNVPSSRGIKMSPLKKWAKDNILPIIVEGVLNIDSYEDMRAYFKNNVFFLGRRDWDRAGYRSDFQIPAYPEYVRLSPSYFDLACLVQAESEKDIALILEYAGSSRGSFANEKNKIYPDGWSFEVYLESLTDEDKEILNKDRERLTRLHGRDIMKDSLLFKNI